MIVTTTRHGRTRRDTRSLLAHLSSQRGQVSRVVHVAAPVAGAADALAYMEALRDGSRATVAFHHISLSPGEALTDGQRDEAVTRLLSALGAEDHAHVVWEHSQKARRGRDVDTHYHVVLSHVGPDGKALRDGHSFRRLEAAARTLEADFGHALTHSRRTAAVAAELDREGRCDVAAMIRNEHPPEPPASAMSSRQRARAERHGHSLPDVRDSVRDAWQRSDGAAAFRAALAESGLDVAAGRKAGVWVVTDADGKTLGALDRLAGERRGTVAARMTKEPPDHDPDPDPAAAAGHARPARDLRRGPRGTGGGAGAEPAPVPPRPGRPRGRPSPGGDGPSGDDRADAGGDPAGRPEPDRPPRPDRAQAALAALALARAAQKTDMHAMTQRLRRTFRPRGRSVVAVHRLGKLDLDDILRQAQELGRQWADMLLGPERRPETRAEAVARLRREHADRKAREWAEARARSADFEDDEAPTYHYRPRI